MAVHPLYMEQATNAIGDLLTGLGRTAMTNPVHRLKFYDTDQDWSTKTFSEADMARLNKWYIDTHGEGNLDLVKFVGMMQDLRPEALKAYRRAIETTVGSEGFESGLGGASVLTWLHTYTVLAYREGILYEIISARYRGATKAQVADTLSIAWLHSGTVGITAAAEAAKEYMQSWDESDPAPGMAFPDGWAADPDAFRAGLDFSNMNAITDAELRSLEEWHLRVQGSVPDYVTVLARHYPVLLKVFRARYETVLTECVLPKEMIPVLFMSTAAAKQNADALRRSAIMAKTFGVTKSQALHALGVVQRLLGDLFSDAAFSPIADLLDDWA
jgi:hypothetical protein